VFAEATLYYELQAALDPATWNKIDPQDLDRLAVIWQDSESRLALRPELVHTLSHSASFPLRDSSYSELLSPSDYFRLAVTIAVRASIDAWPPGHEYA